MEIKGVFPLKRQLLQSSWLMLALAEKYDVKIPLDYKPEIDYLKQFFDINFEYAQKGDKKIEGIEINHPQPYVKFGDQKRILLFPEFLVNYCQEQTMKKFFVSFRGFKADFRVKFLTEWAKKIMGCDLDSELLNINFTNAGRVSIGRVFDKKYYEEIKQSSFTICPNGGYVYTYRFFEACFCRSIPIIQDFCKSYEGYKFYDQTTKKDDLIYRSDWAEHNLNKAIKDLTLIENE